VRINTPSQFNTLEPWIGHTLIDSLSEKSAVTVAAIFGVSRRTIYRWCKKYDVPRRVYGCPDRELLRQLEANCTLQKHIARTFGVSRWTIRLWCQKFGIAHYTTGRFRRGTKGNVPHIHEEMPFGIGMAFGDELD
jgi:transposase